MSSTLLNMDINLIQSLSSGFVEWYFKIKKIKIILFEIKIKKKKLPITPTRSI